MTKRVNRKRTTKKKTAKFNSAIVVGMFLMIIGLLGLISMLSTQVGILGDYLREAFLALFAFMTIPACILVLVTGVLLIHAQRKTHSKKIILLWIILLIVLVLFDSQTGTSQMTMRDRMHFAYENSQTATGGGILGAIAGFGFYRLLGVLGTFVFGILGICFFLFILFDIKVEPIKRWFLTTYHQTRLWFETQKKKHGEEKKAEPEQGQHSPLIIHHTNYNLKDESDLEDMELIPIWDGRQSKKENEKEDMVIAEQENVVTDKEDVVEIEKDDAVAPPAVEVQETSNSHSPEDFACVHENVVQPYEFPPIDLLLPGQDILDHSGEKTIIARGKKIEDTLRNFNMEVKVKSISHGPTITRYELEPSPDIKLSRIVNLQDNIALALAASNIRIEAPIPGKSLIGIEVPNRQKSSVALRDLLETSAFKEHKSSLPLVLGQDVTGVPIIESIDKMPHLLICGATGSGKSVCINSIILGLLYKSKPEDVKMILVDPKVVELNVYNRIPHLMIPVITDPKKASMALNWGVNEMERRYKLFAKNGARDIQGYRKKQEDSTEMEKLPLIVIIIDELADLMMVASKDIEEQIARLAQMARAAGIHMIVATQRPSVDVITGTIKANIPSRIAFAVSSQTDSRTILDMGGAEKLLGKGDMLFFPSYYDKPKRIQGCFISDEEIEKVVDFVASSEDDRFNPKIIQAIETKSISQIEETDSLLDDAISIVLAEQQASVSYLQRRLKLGYSRAARMIDQLEELGVVSSRDGTKPRQVLMTQEEWEHRQES